ncbi:MAG: hypothetical protein KC609_19220 [Myxococcales bacterium]|nr:hypothetical protein [Myxococcales bacterium]
MRNFNGFSVAVDDRTDFYDAMRFNQEATLLALALIERIGKRIRKHEYDSGWDTRTGRDYFYSNYIIWTARKDPSYIGIFHYRQPEDYRGTQFQVWRYEHDSEPAFQLSAADLYREVDEVAKSGRLGDWLDKKAEEIRLALGLR